MYQDIKRCFQYTFRLYAGSLKYLFLSAGVGFALFFIRPLFSPLIVQGLFNNLHAKAVSNVFSIAVFSVFVGIILTILSYYIFVYADAWTIYLITCATTKSFKNLYDMTSSELNGKFNDEEEFNRITEGCDAPASCVTIIVQCLALSISILILLFTMISVSKILFFFGILLIVFEIIRVCYEINKGTKLSHKTQEVNTRLCGLTNTVINHLDQILFYDGSDDILKEFENMQREYWQCQCKYQMLKINLNFAGGLVYSGVTAGCFHLISNMPTLQIGMFSAVNTMLDTYRSTTNMAVRFSGELPEYLAKMKRYDEIYQVYSNAADRGILCDHAVTNDVECNNVSLSFGETEILNQVSFCIQRGEKVAVVGPNGSGKTTLLRVLLGEIPINSGSVCLNGNPSCNLRHLDKFEQIAYIPLDNQLFQVNASTNVKMGSLSESVSAPKDFDDFSHTMIKHLSAGQQRKTNITRALQKSVPLLLADEPEAQLDTISADIYLSRILDSTQTVIMVTHDSRLLCRFDSILLINNKKIDKISYDQFQKIQKGDVFV
ncbi:MAG: ABC transporter ATP-binding protein [Lachnospiraceae bacterium]